MGTSIEIEVKALIKEGNYQKLIKYFDGKAEEKYSQTNYYIDSCSRELKRCGIALRIRELDGKIELTLKTPLSEGLLEKSQLLTKEEFESFKKDKVFPVGEINRLLTMLGIEIGELFIITSLTTERINIKNNDYHISLDKNTYSNVVDYELEVEYNSLSGAEEELEKILADNNIKYERNLRSKQMRAIEVYTRLHPDEMVFPCKILI